MASATRGTVISGRWRLLGLLVCIGGATVLGPFAGRAFLQADPNAYFNALVARPDHWRSNSLRSQALIDGVSQGKPNMWVRYDASVDAARTVIPAFVDIGLRVVSTGSDRVTFERPLTQQEKNQFTQYRSIMVGGEIMTVKRWYTFGEQFTDGDTTLLVDRAQFGTSLESHGAGTPALISQNNLLNQARVPLGTEDGNSYLFTWDVRYDVSYLGTDLNVMTIGRKEFMLTQGPRGTLWLETRIRPDGKDGIGNANIDRRDTVAVIDARYYDLTVPTAPGSNVTSVDSLRPQSGRFLVKADKWTRFWWFIDQRADDFDVSSLWVADEDTGPVQIFSGLTLRTGGAPPTVYSWWLEQNTSQDVYRGSKRDLISHVRNFVALRNPQAVDSLLIRPLAGVPPEPRPAPSAPRNLRVQE